MILILPSRWRLGSRDGLGRGLVEISLAFQDRALDKSSCVVGLLEASPNECGELRVVFEALGYCLFC